MTPITIISGFLGAGKTTFANYFLDYHIRTGETTAYVVNEFGQTGLDSALIGQKGFQTTDIFGGCVCCTLRGKISVALGEILQDFKPARIVFEPSGIFIFEKFLEVLEAPALKGNCFVDSVITIVDSLHINDAMFVPGNFFANQVSHADTIVLSKLESFEGDVEALSLRVGTLNERAGVVAIPFSQWRDEDFAALTKGGSDGVGADDGQTQGHAHMNTVTIAPRAYDSAALTELTKLFQEGYFGEVYRIKGKVIFEGEPKVLQATFDSLKLDGDPPEGGCTLTFIGKSLQKDRIRQCWQ